MSQSHAFYLPCDRLRRKDGGEDFWNSMMRVREKVPRDLFLGRCDLTGLLGDESLTPDEELNEFIQSDPDSGFYRSRVGCDEVFFIQTAGFEFVFTAGGALPTAMSNHAGIDGTALRVVIDEVTARFHELIAAGKAQDAAALLTSSSPDMLALLPEREDRHVHYFSLVVSLGRGTMEAREAGNVDVDEWLSLVEAISAQGVHLTGPAAAKSRSTVREYAEDADEMGARRLVFLLSLYCQDLMRLASTLYGLGCSADHFRSMGDMRVRRKPGAQARLMPQVRNEDIVGALLRLERSETAAAASPEVSTRAAARNPRL